MLEIRTIADFQRLPDVHRMAILKEIKTKIRLEDWLRSLNDKKKNKITKPIDVRCRNCGGSGKITLTPRNSSDIHPSQLHKCVKKIWMDCSGYHDRAEGFIDSRLRLIFDIGRKVHEMFQEYGYRGAWGPGKNYYAEFNVDPDAKHADGTSVHPMAEAFWIRGSIDALIDPYLIKEVPGLGPVAIRVVHEYKTINSGGYGRLTRPKADHKWQATIYSVAVDAPVVVFIYLNKDTSQFADFPVPYDPSLMYEIEKKIISIQGYVESSTVPPWEETAATLNPYECSNCEYMKICNPPTNGKVR
jgi:CRISPR/Cas system-associated exonuclease Cas4 (RecB family)